MLGALVAAARFVARRPGRVAGLYLLNALLFAVVVGLYALVAPGATGNGWSMRGRRAGGPGVPGRAALGEAGVLRVGGGLLPGRAGARGLRGGAAAGVARIAGRRTALTPASGPGGVRPARLTRYTVCCVPRVNDPHLRGVDLCYDPDGTSLSGRRCLLCLQPGRPARGPARGLRLIWRPSWPGSGARRSAETRRRRHSRQHSGTHRRPPERRGVEVGASDRPAAPGGAEGGRARDRGDGGPRPLRPRHALRRDPVPRPHAFRASSPRSSRATPISTSTTCVGVIVDPFLDHRNGFFFAVNPAGARADGQVSNNAEEIGLDWDGIWDAAAAHHRRRLDGRDRHPVQDAALQARPDHVGPQRRAAHQAAQRDRPLVGAAPGHLDLATSPRPAGSRASSGIRQGRGLDIRPYVSLGRENSDGEVQAGLDVFKNLTPNLNASLTVNTDFAETEVDARQINLTRFPLFFPEKRAFFLEGAGVFDDRGLDTSTATCIPFFTPAHRPAPRASRCRSWRGRQGHRPPVGLQHRRPRRADARPRRPTRDAGQNLLAARVSRNIFRQSWIGGIVTHGNPDRHRPEHARRRRRPVRHVRLPRRQEPEPRPLLPAHRRRGDAARRTTRAASGSTTRTTCGTSRSAGSRSARTSARRSASCRGTGIRKALARASPSCPARTGGASGSSSSGSSPSTSPTSRTASRTGP